MSERVSTSITIGGSLSQQQLPTFLEAIQQDSAGPEFDTSLDTVEDLVDEIEQAVSERKPLSLYAAERRGGNLDAITAFCQAHDLTYVHAYDAGSEWSEGMEWWAPGMGAEKEGFAAAGQPAITREELARLASLPTDGEVASGLRALLAEETPPSVPPFVVPDLITVVADA